MYEKLGVKTFKKYVPTSGDLIYRIVWKRLGEPDLIKSKNLSSLKNAEFATRLLETVHLAGFTFMASELGIALANKNITVAAYAAGLNMLINVYPIMLQRYNRLRLYKVIRQMQAISPLPLK